MEGFGFASYAEFFSKQIQLLEILVSKDLVQSALFCYVTWLGVSFSVPVLW